MGIHWGVAFGESRKHRELGHGAKEGSEHKIEGGTVLGLCLVPPAPWGGQTKSMSYKLDCPVGRMAQLVTVS